MKVSDGIAACTEELQREQNLRIASQLQEDFECLAAGLDAQIRAEEERTRVSNPSDVAYSMFAKVARARREKLLRSREEITQYLNSVHALEDYPENQCIA